MKKVYIVLSQTGTLLSRLIRLKTGAEYAHSSIALDENLRKMYSFGRLYPYIAFIGGFVRESKYFGTFRRFKKTQVSIFEIDVTDKQYEEISNNINFIKYNKKNYRFNILGLFLAGINKKNDRENTFYCAEFVKYILTKSGVDVSYLPDVIKPEDFKKLENATLIYKGYLKEYPTEKINIIDYLKTITIDQKIRI